VILLAEALRSTGVCPYLNKKISINFEREEVPMCNTLMPQYKVMRMNCEHIGKCGYTPNTCPLTSKR
jgi:ribosomal protein S27AE